MAESGSESTESPGIGMRMTISSIQMKFPSVKNLTTQALFTLMNACKSKEVSSTIKPEEKLLIVDSRPEEEYTISHIPDAYRVDYEADADAILDALPELKSPDVKTIVVCYCSVGYRSSMVAKKIYSQLKEKGLFDENKYDIYNLEGSLFKWANENRPMVDNNNKTTKFAHPYNAVFGKLLNKELRKSTAEESQL